MANERKRFERDMKHILRYIHKNGLLPELDDRGLECLYHCTAEKGYILGLKASRVASGKPVFDITSDHLKLTKAGLDFCWKPIPWEMGINIILGLITILSTTIAIIQWLS